MNQRLYGLDALRGIAALLVAAFHAAMLWGFPDAVAELTGRAYLAVDLFFLLSGYVLARTYEERMPGVLAFTGLRFTRLWPPVALGMAIGAAWAFAGGEAWSDLAPMLFVGLLLVPYRDYTFDLNSPAWSIFFELVGNALHALVLRFLPIWALLGIVVFSFGVLTWYAAFGAITGHPGLDVGHAHAFWYGVPRLLMSYCLGIVLFRLHWQLSLIPGWVGLIALPLVLVAAYLWLPRWAEPAFVVIVFPPILLAAMAGAPARLAAVLGALSFPLYALHMPLLKIAFTTFADWRIAFVFAVLGTSLLGLAVDGRSRRNVARLIVGRPGGSASVADASRAV